MDLDQLKERQTVIKATKACLEEISATGFSNQRIRKASIPLLKELQTLETEINSKIRKAQKVANAKAVKEHEAPEPEKDPKVEEQTEPVDLGTEEGASEDPPTKDEPEPEPKPTPVEKPKPAKPADKKPSTSEKQGKN